MWLVFVLITMFTFIGLLFAVWLANKVMIAIQKDNDKYTKEKEGKVNGNE